MPTPLEQVLPLVQDFCRPLVFTNGAFRLFHYGHLSCLREAASQGRCLVVGINSDASLAALGREPLQTAEQRAAVVESMLPAWQCHYVVFFHEPTPEKLIELLRPDVLVKGGDYVGQLIVGGEFVRSYGGRVYFSRYVEGISTTSLICGKMKVS